ncbi:MAG: hypothetical protein Alpg2KO_00480 [Alphaproteobacteria bacterium]
MTAITDLLTTPGGIKLLFRENGTNGFRDLGDMNEPNLGTELETVEKYSSRSGRRVLVKEQVISTAYMLEFAMAWIGKQQLRYGMQGGALSEVAAGDVVINKELIGLLGVTPQGLVYPPSDTAGETVNSLDEATTYDAETTYAVTAVTDAGAGSANFAVAGDLAAKFAEGRTFTVTDSTGNDGTYTVASGGAVHAGGTTTIPVDEAVPDSTGDGTITAGDYVLTPAERTIKRSALSTITSGDEVLVSYNWDAPAHSTFNPGRKGIFTGDARIVMFPESGAQIDWEIPKVQLRAGDGIDFNDEEFMEIPAVLKALDASETNPTAPFGTIRHWILPDA